MSSESVHSGDLGNLWVFRGKWKSLLSLGKELIRGVISLLKYIWRGSTRKKVLLLGQKIVLAQKQGGWKWTCVKKTCSHQGLRTALQKQEQENCYSYLSC